MHTEKVLTIFHRLIKNRACLLKNIFSTGSFLLLQIPGSISAHNNQENKLGGHELIIVKGFQNQPYNSDLIPSPLGGHIDFDFNFPMDQHIYHSDGAGRALYKHLKENGKCKESCILLTASTGDLVARYFIENQKYWAKEDDIEPFNVVATIDFVGAGGGVEAAQYVHLGEVVQYIYELTGNDLTGPVAQDLIPSHARSLADNFHTHGVPRFRISANFLLTSGGIMPWVPSLVNDGLVSAHSSCGVDRQKLALNSCSDNVNYFGETHGSLIPIIGPSSLNADLWDYHYPVIMTDGMYNHASIGLNQNLGGKTYINQQINENDVGFNFLVDEYELHAPIPVPVEWGWIGPCPWCYWGPTAWEYPLIYRKQWITGTSVNKIVHDKFVGDF